MQYKSVPRGVLAVQKCTAGHVPQYKSVPRDVLAVQSCPAGHVPQYKSVPRDVLAVQKCTAVHVLRDNFVLQYKSCSTCPAGVTTLLASDISESQLSKADERMFELGLLSLEAAGIDKYIADKLTGTISSRGFFDVPKRIREELDKILLPEATKDLITRSIVVDSQHRADLNQAMRTYCQRRNEALMAMHVVSSAIKKYFESNQLPIMKRDVNKAWEVNSTSIIEEMKRGNSQGLWIKGVMHTLGTGIEKDYEEAVRLYRLAADAGHASAQCSLGYMYETGNGVEKDYKEAVSLYRLAADAGDSDAQVSLGQMYQSGDGV